MAGNRKPSRAGGQMRTKNGNLSGLPQPRDWAALAVVLGPSVFFYSVLVVSFSHAVSNGADAKWCAAFGVFSTVAFIYSAYRSTKNA